MKENSVNCLLGGVMRMGYRHKSANNQGILLLAALASIQIAQQLDQDQIEVLAAFFEVLGNNLALLISPPCWNGFFDDLEETAKE